MQFTKREYIPREYPILFNRKRIYIQITRFCTGEDPNISDQCIGLFFVAIANYFILQILQIFDFCASKTKQQLVFILCIQFGFNAL